MFEQRKRNKFTKIFKLEPYTVTKRRGTQKTAEIRRHTVTRNAFFFKKMKSGSRESDEREDFDERETTTREMNIGERAPRSIAN